MERLATKKGAVAKETAFGKEQILASAKYKGRHDLLDALLVDGKSYTAKEVDEKIERYMKGKVK